MTTMKRLLATASLLVSASGFVSRPRVGGAEATASSRSTSDCNMLQPEKFDRVIETKRTSIGYDSDSGRFFEMQNGPDSVLTESVESVSVESTSLVDPESTPSDIPPIPDAGFDGMNITGEINGVKMTSRGSPRRKQETNLLADGDSSSSDQAQTEDGNGMRSKTFADRITNSGAVSAAAVATAAVNAAVSMKTLTAPSVDKSYISLDSAKEVDGEGLPLTYDKDLIEAYWAKERGALNQRWSYFVGKAVPFLTRLVTLFISEGEINERHIPGLSRQAREDLQDLGPTFIKAGQMMSVRPDVLPQSTLDELTKLQDAVVPFDTEIAVKLIEEELGPLGHFFTSISEEPVAAASLAQVYLATLNDGKDTRVAIKVQRPQVLSTVSKDLYVLRRAAEVFQGLVERFAPQQKTNYVALLNEWAIGFYTELDFQNEGRNQERLRTSLIEAGVKGIVVPKVYQDMCTRRILVSEWMDGVKLSECESDEIADITNIAQEAFLLQLFDFGFFHADPHPGNIMKLHEPTPEGHTVALLDCGLMASIDSADQDQMISAVVHLANKDYSSLVDDFINLKILPSDCDRMTIIPLMDKALSPYVAGGGAKKYEEELKRLYGMEEGDVSSTVGGFQSMTQDALTVLNDVPFSIPPYFAILGRAIVTLEGIALTGNPNYGIIMETYPFIARRLLKEGRPEIQQALQEVLFSASTGLQLNRLFALLNNSQGSVGTKEGAVFVDLDAVPEDGLSLADAVKLLLSDDAESLRALLESEVENIADILLRQILRKGATETLVAITPPRLPSLPFIGDFLSPPRLQLEEVRLPFALPVGEGDRATPSISLMTVNEFTDLVAPRLSREEEVYAISIVDAVEQLLGNDVASFLRGDDLLSIKTSKIIFASFKSGLLGNRDLLESANAASVTKALSDVLSRLDRGGSKDVGRRITEATTALSLVERRRLDDIVTELQQRIIERVIDRLAIKTEL